MMRRFLLWLTGFLPARIISQGDEPYLERYYVGTLFGWRFYLHQFVGDDPDRGPHDHPWSLAFSIVLAGWYIEERRGRKPRPVRRFNWLTGDTFHRVILPSSVPVWTLFCHRVGDVKAWGFMREPTGNVAPKGTLLFVPYQYKREGGKPVAWWRTAPKGREIRTQ